jgi:hypothetical protein
MAALAKVGISVLEQLAPEMLERPRPLNVTELIDKKLALYGIFVAEGSWAEMGACHGLTFPSDSGVEILLCPETWAAVFELGPKSNMARATFAHELSHAILHAPTLRRKMRTAATPSLARRSDLRPFEDPEWQAWALGGQLLAPQPMLQTLSTHSLSEAAYVFRISEQMLRSHLRRLKMERRFPNP